MKFSILFISVILLTCHSCSQTNSKEEVMTVAPKVGGGCEGCEGIYESPEPFEKLKPVDTLPDFFEEGQKIVISGIVYQSDERTPAKDVVIYIYHTDQRGKYSPAANATGWGKRHGYVRGWARTDQNGSYKFYTLVPASYPNSNNPKHIHPVIKEQDKNEYYIDEFLFDDDPFLTNDKRDITNPRGGNGIIKTIEKGGVLYAYRKIILGQNVPDYPIAKKTNIESGLAIGENCPAFDPLHLSGADKGKSVCPMCKYGFGKGVMIWFNHNNFDPMKKFVTSLENEMERRGEKNFRVFLVYMNPSYHQNNEGGLKILQGKIQQWSKEQHLKKVAMVLVPSPVDEETCGIYKINPEAKNTVFVYKKRIVVAKMIDMSYDDDAINKMLAAIDLPG